MPPTNSSVTEELFHYAKLLGISHLKSLSIKIFINSMANSFPVVNVPNHQAVSLYQFVRRFLIYSKAVSSHPVVKYSVTFVAEYK